MSYVHHFIRQSPRPASESSTATTIDPFRTSWYLSADIRTIFADNRVISRIIATVHRGEM